MSGESFATIEDLESRFRKLDKGERTKAVALLEDAAVLIRTELTGADIAIDLEDPLQASELRIVSCSVVKRALSGGAGESITQSSRTAGPYSYQVTYANPTADLYLTKQDKRVLGIPQSGKGYASIRPLICKGGNDA